MHTNAWSQGLILVIHDHTRVTSEIEELLSRANPSLEESIVTFNCPRQAVDFSKGRTDVALCIIKDQFEDISGVATYENIKIVSSNEVQIPPIAVLIFDENPRLDVFKKISKNKSIIDYISKNSLSTSTEITSSTLNSLFNEYTTFVESIAAPSEVANILFDLCSRSLNEKFRIKYERICNVVTTQLNISAVEHNLIKWLPYLESIDNRITEIANPQSLLLRSANLFQKERIALAQSYSHEIRKIAEIDSNEIESFFQREKQQLRPSSLAIKKVIFRNAEKIISIIKAIESDETDHLQEVA